MYDFVKMAEAFISGGNEGTDPNAVKGLGDNPDTKSSNINILGAYYKVQQEKVNTAKLEVQKEKVAMPDGGAAEAELEAELYGLLREQEAMRMAPMLPEETSPGLSYTLSAVDDLPKEMAEEPSPIAALEESVEALEPMSTEIDKAPTHTVVGGDILEDIAEANNTTVKTLLSLNPDIKDKDHIQRGQEITLPRVNLPKEDSVAKVAGLMSPEVKEDATTVEATTVNKEETSNTTSIPAFNFIVNKGTTKGDEERSVYEYAYEQGLRDDEIKSFMSQVAHESKKFSDKTEDGYTKSNVKSITKSRYKVGDMYKAKPLKSGNPMVGQFKSINRRRFVRDGVTNAEGDLQNYSAANVFNSMYANRNGNGDFASGDGSRYKGRGYIQLTGRGNYRKIGNDIGEDLEGNPDLMLDPVIAKKASVAWWKRNVQPEKPDYTDVRAVTRIVNGGTNGLSERRENFKIYSMSPKAKSK